jgi:hypothetical protein
MTDADKLALIYGIVWSEADPHDWQHDDLAEVVTMVRYVTSYLGIADSAEKQAAWDAMLPYMQTQIGKVEGKLQRVLAMPGEPNSLERAVASRLLVIGMDIDMATDDPFWRTRQMPEVQKKLVEARRLWMEAMKEARDNAKAQDEA